MEQKPHKSRKSYYRLSLTCLRWTIILAMFAIVLKGWVLSVQKYSSGKTSIGAMVNETSTLIYPSITFCSGIRAMPYLKYSNISEYLQAQNSVTIQIRSNITRFIKDSSFSREDFLSNFSLLSMSAKNLVNDDSYWVTTTPNMVAGGNCYTFNPRNESRVGKYQGFYYKLRYPDSFAGSAAEKMSWLRMAVGFVHDKDKFSYYLSHEQPSSVKLHTSQLKMGFSNLVTIDYSRFTSIDKSERPCVQDESQSFSDCFEIELAKRRGCQKWWFHYPNLNIRKCNNDSEIKGILTEEWDQAQLSAKERASLSGCQQPCTRSIYKLEYYSLESTQQSQSILGHDELEAYVFFKNFEFQYSEEYLVCDITCLVGEIGGNFGFFLGGSVLALFDVVYYQLLLLVTK